jgi:hypothetical protein
MKPEVGMRVNVRSLLEDGWHVLYRRAGRPKLYLSSLEEVNRNYLPNGVVEIIIVHGQTTFLAAGAKAQTVTQTVEVVAAPEGATLE